MKAKSIFKIEYIWVKPLENVAFTGKWRLKTEFRNEEKMRKAFSKMKQKNLFCYRMVFPDGKIEE